MCYKVNSVVDPNTQDLDPDPNWAKIQDQGYRNVINLKKVKIKNYSLRTIPVETSTKEIFGQ